VSPHRLCSEAYCPNLAHPKGRGKCLEHRREYERERSARRREKTKGVYKRKVWAMRRKQAFGSDPQCAWVLNDGTRCQRLGEELDHVVPLDAGGDEYAATNLQLLCAEHHRLKTARENRERLTLPPAA
jgi:5-methylcytosine-specific restriction endonuclease McrA